MYVSAYSRSVGASTSKTDQSIFDLFESPAQDVSRDPQAFFLGSDAYQVWVAAVEEHEDCIQSNDNRGGVSCRTVSEVNVLPIQRFTSADVSSLAVLMQAAPPYEGQPNGTQSIMIESYRYPRRYFSLSAMSWNLDASYGDGGAGSYWIPEPPLGIQMQAYSGPRCSFDCGAYGSGTSRMIFVIAAIVSIVFVAAGSGTYLWMLYFR
jgi:hypothetical protein